MRTIPTYVVTFLVMLLHAAAAFAGVTVEEQQIGVAGLIRAGDWVRFSLTIAADAAGFDGSASLSLGRDARTRPFRLPPYGRAVWEDVTHVSPFTGGGVVVFRSQDGSETQTILDVAPTLSRDDVGMVALVRRRGLVSGLADQPASIDSKDGEPAGRFVVHETGSIRSLPETWMAWSGVDVVVWSGVDPRSTAWTIRRQEAFTQWILQGGTLICVDDGVMDGWDASFVAPLLPYIPERRVAMTYRNVELPVYVGARRDASMPLLPTESDFAAAVIEHGLGRVFFVGLAMSSFASGDLGANVWPAILSEARQSPLRSWHHLQTRLREHLLTRLDAPTSGRGGLSSRTKRLAYASVSWLLVMGVLGAWLCRSRPRRPWVPIGILALGASAVPLALESRTPTVPARESGVLRVFPRYGVGLWEGILTVPSGPTRAVRVPFRVDPHAAPLSSGHDGSWLTHTEDQETAGELVDVRPRSDRGLHWQARAFVPFVGGLRIDRSPSDASSTAYSVVNDTAWTFTRAAVVDGNSVALLDELLPGDAVVAELRELPRRRELWSALSLPPGILVLLDREGDALIPSDRPSFLGTMRRVSALGPDAGKGARRRAPTGHVLLVIVPIDIR